MNSFGAVVALMALTQAPSGQQFDLTCSGEVQRRAIGEDGPFVPWTGVIKVDLQAGSFCQDACQMVEQLGRVTPEVIEIGHREATSHTDLSSVNRRTGQYRRMVTRFEAGGRGTSEIYRGTCEPAPFSGFPETRF